MCIPTGSSNLPIVKSTILMPHIVGNDIFFRIRAAATPILVSVPSPLDPLSLALIPAIEAAYACATIPIKALVLSNPHNPLGRCYERKVLEECVNFCHRQKIHLISDEVFALSTFRSTDIPEAQGFVSVLALDRVGLESEAGRVSVIWSTSKDLGCSGLKVVRSVFFFFFSSSFSFVTSPLFRQRILGNQVAWCGIS